MVVGRRGMNKVTAFGHPALPCVLTDMASRGSFVNVSNPESSEQRGPF